MSKYAWDDLELPPPPGTDFRNVRETPWQKEEPTGNPKDILGLKKPPLRLIPPSALIYLSRVMALGAERYGPFNWRENPVKSLVYIEANMRHALTCLDGETLDPESTQPHMAHAMACCAIWLDAYAIGNLIDDRPTPGVTAKLITELTEK